MPQFDAATFPSQLFWLFLCFGVLLWFNRFISVPRISKALGQREARIAQALNQANQDSAEIEASCAAVHSRLESARKEARDRLALTTDNVHKAAAQKKAEIVKTTDIRWRACEATLREHTHHAADDVERISHQLSTAFLQKLGFIHVDPVVIQTAVTQALAAQAKDAS